MLHREGNDETRRGDAATGSDVFTHLPRLFGYLAEAPLTPARRFDRCRGALLIATFPVALVAIDTFVTLRRFEARAS
jgi:hypothetical protein